MITRAAVVGKYVTVLNVMFVKILRDNKYIKTNWGIFI